MKSRKKDFISASYRISAFTLLCGALVVLPGEADAVNAANVGLTGLTHPWESPLQTISSSLQGPVVKAGSAAAIALAGLGLALGESGGLVRKIGGVVAGGAVAANAATWGLPFLGFTGSVPI